MFLASLTLLAPPTLGRDAPVPKLPTLTSAQQIRELTHDQANLGYPVRLRAVVTYANPSEHDVFVQDGTAGIYLNDTSVRFDFKPGQFIEVEGVTEELDFAPQVAKPRYRLLGKAPLPAPARATFGDLVSTRYDSQWVEFHGVVHQAVEDGGHLDLRVGRAGDEMEIFVLAADGLKPQSLIDTKLRINGVCESVFNSKNQLTGVELLVPDGRDMVVEEPAPADPFHIPVRSISSVLSFAARGASEHRIRVQGTVTLVRPRGVFIQDRSQGLYIPGAVNARVKPGDRVDVLGFADVGDYTPVLRYAEFRTTGTLPLPAPVSITAKQAQGGAFDTLRVTLDGTLRGRQQNGIDRILVLEDAGLLFEVRMVDSWTDSTWKSLVAGSRLRVTGVCSVQVERSRVPNGFAILLDSPGGLTVLARPSWWTLRNTLVALAFLAALTLAVLGWVAVLKRRVRQQTETILRRLENEAALEKRFQYVARATNDVIWDCDFRTQAVKWSENLQTTFQYTPDQIGPDISWRYAQIHPDDRERIESSLKAVAGRGEEKWSAEYRFRRAGGEYAYVFDRGYFMYDGAGTPVRAIGAMMDVSAGKQAEEALAHERNLLRTLIDNVPDLIYVRDTEGRFLVANGALARLVGAERPEDLLGKTDFDLFPSELARSYWAEDQQVLQSGGALVGREQKVVDSEGRTGCVLTTKVPLRDPHGALVGLVGVDHDITARKQAEAEIEWAREAAEAASRAKSEFLANMSHEIRTPMNGIIGMTELALETELSREQRQYLEAVKASADALLGIINDILDFSKIEAGRLELCPAEFNIWSCLEETVRLSAPQAQRKGIELVCDIEPQVPEFVTGDPGRLRQVVSNLVENAVKFTERGEVALEAAMESQGGEETKLHFVVRDTGIGIPPGKQSLIFNAFQQADGSTTRRFGGTGLGLTISQRLVRLMGGQIWVESEEGRGSRFHFTCTFKIAPAARRGSDAESQAPFAGVRALVTDSNASSRHALQKALSAWGMEVVGAERGVSALAKLRQAKASGRPFSVVIVDMGKPESEGFAVAAGIQREPALAGALILAQPAGARKAASEPCRAHNAAAYVSKPYFRSELQAAVRVALDGRGAAQPTAAQTLLAAEEETTKASILVAEDNPVNRVLAVRLVEKFGYAAGQACNGREALNAVEAHRPDLILMDVQMPEMDGFEATAAIRELERQQGGHLPIIAMTAHALKGDRERCLEMGMDDYVSKPIQAAELLRAIESQIGPARMAAARDSARGKPDGPQLRHQACGVLGPSEAQSSVTALLATGDATYRNTV